MLLTLLASLVTPLQSHLGGAHLDKPAPFTWMPDVWDYLIRKYGIKSVIDLGCGAGFTTAWFQKHVDRVLGLEGDPRAYAARKCDAITLHDFTCGPYIPSEHYDFGWCAEFVEHVEPRFMLNWMKTLTMCKYVCITFARPGQGGWHHVNEQNDEYWLKCFKKAGFQLLLPESLFLRRTASGQPWGRPTLTLFQNCRESFWPIIKPEHENNNFCVTDFHIIYNQVIGNFGNFG